MEGTLKLNGTRQWIDASDADIFGSAFANIRASGASSRNVDLAGHHHRRQHVRLDRT